VNEKVRAKRRRDLLRLQLIRLLEVVCSRSTMAFSSSVLPSFSTVSSSFVRSMLSETGELRGSLLDFLETARQFLESDQDRDMQIFTSMRLHFAKMIALLVHQYAPERRAHLVPNDKKQNMFLLFTSWCSKLGMALDRK